MKRAFVAVFAVGGLCASLQADDVGSYDSATQTLTYDLAADATETKAFSGYGTVTKVVKKGAGKLTVTPLNTDFKGAIDIEAGILSAGSTADTDTKVFGTATITVKSGAQFRSTQKCIQHTSYMTSCTFTIEGAGPDGSGAIYVNPDGSGDRSIPSTTLAGPATIGGSGRWGFGGTLDMNGHTLTNKTSNQFMWTAVTLKNPGHIVQAPATASGYITLESKGLSGGADHVLTIALPSIVNYWVNWQENNWTLRVMTNAYCRASAGNGETCNWWQGPVEIAKGATLNMQQNYNSWSADNTSLAFTGEISGEGGVKANSANGNVNSKTCSVYLKHANTYTGGTTIESGNILVHAKADQSIPTAGGLSITGGKVQMYMGTEGGWTAEHAHALYDCFKPSSACGEALSFYTPANASATDTIAFTAKTGVVVHKGEGTLTSSGGFRGNHQLVNQSGTWKISGNHSDHNIASFNAWLGSLVFEDAGYIDMTNRQWTVGTSEMNKPGKVVFKGNTVLGGFPSVNNRSGDANMIVGTWTRGYRGIVEIEDGAIVSNKLHLGDSWGTLGAAYQHGGTMVQDCSPAHDSFWSRNGYGAYVLTGGTLIMKNCHNIGGRTGGTGILDMRNGTAISKEQLFLGSGGTGVVHVTGGTFTNETGNLFLGQLQWAEDGKIPGRSIFTMAGDEAEAVVKGSMALCQRTNGAAAFVNLNAGVFEATSFLMRNYWSGAAWGTLYGTNPKSRGLGYVNFNGGTFRCRANGAIFNTDPKYRINRVTVYERGATIDTNGKDCSIGMPLDRPLGYGVKAIALPAGFANTNYLGRQVIAIHGGDANAIEALAITDFDENTKTISKVEIVSPGSGYAESDAVRASVPSCTYVGTATELKVTLGENVGGGLTKTGEGTLTLAATNTYAGATIVSNGTLKVAIAEALPKGSGVTVVVGKGTLDVTGIGLAATSSLTLDVGALPTGRPEARSLRRATIAKGLKAMPTLTNPEALPYPWALKMRANGDLDAVCNTGFSILVK